MDAHRQPRVYLVGAGPGDPGLLTRRGAVALARADVVLYDNLTSPALLDLARPEARRLYVGKKPRSGPTDQEGINARLVELAREGLVVVRLKGGDGYVFGRGGEEALALLEAGIPFEVVPGVSSATAGPAAAGIPPSHRGLATSFHVAVGHEDPDSPTCSVRWEALARAGGTIVILMATHTLGGILRRLRAGGLPEDTPVATVRHATRPDQRSLRSTLGAALADPASVALPPPAITVVGAVAGLPAELNWFERRPLFGRRVALVRPEESGDAHAEALREAGADVVSIAATRFVDLGPDARAGFLEDLAWARAAGGWLALPSPAAIRHAFAALEEAGLDARALAGLRLAAVGERTGADLRERGIRPDFTPPRATGASLAATIPLDPTATGAPGAAPRALVAGSAIGRPDLPEGLAARGFEVRRRALYDTVADEAGVEAIRATLAPSLAPASGTSPSDSSASEPPAARPPDALVVFSPSSVAAILDDAPEAVRDAARGVRWVAIGPTTSDSLRARGLDPAAEARTPSADDLLEAVILAASVGSSGESSDASGDSHDARRDG